MTMPRHYDDEHLISMLDSESDLSDEHLLECASCRSVLESYRDLTASLRQPEAWKAPADHGAAAAATAVRELAVSIERAAAAAEILADEIIALPRQWWAKKVDSESRFHAAAVARALTARSEAAIDAVPLDAVELSRAAVVAADASKEALAIGSAYRQYAYALFYSGDVAAALAATERSAEALAGCPISEYELARLDIVRAVVFTAQDRYHDAIAAARAAQKVFRAFADRKRLVSALLSEAYVLLGQLRYRDALPVLRSILQDYNDDVDHDTRARVLANLALSLWQTGSIADALHYYELAAAMHESNGTWTEALRVRFNVAGLLAAAGRHEQAKARLQSLRDEFAGRGMHRDAVLTDLIRAEILLAEGAYESVEALCRIAIQEFERSGQADTSEASTALAYLREASHERRATVETIQKVSQIVHRLRQEPQILLESHLPMPE